jgi:hypothetical protein
MQEETPELEKLYKKTGLANMYLKGNQSGYEMMDRRLKRGSFGI